MIIILGSLFLVLVGIALALWGIQDFDRDWGRGLGALLIAVFGLVLLFTGIGAISESISPEHKFEQDMIEYQVLQYEEENNYTTFAQDVVKYNQKVNSYQKWHDNPWLNWFYYDGCENLPYYEFEGFNLKGD